MSQNADPISTADTDDGAHSPTGHIARGTYSGATAEMVEGLRREFFDETLERLQEFESTEIDQLGDIREFFFQTRGQAHNFDLPLLEVVCRQAENYLSALTSLDERRQLDIRRYLDTATDILEGTISPDTDPAQLVRTLPGRISDGFSPDQIEIREVEVMLVMHHNAQTHFIEREVQACGYRVTIITGTLEALAHATRTKPDFMIVSAVMPGLSGIDLVIGLSHMPETRNIPLALITSLPPSSDWLRVLPDGIPIIRKGPTFGDDLAHALNEAFLL